MGYTKLEQAITDLAAPVAAMEDCFIYDVEYIKEAGVRFLRIYADKEETQATGEKISLDECEAISRKLSDLLDNTDIIDENYYLEISSPGAARRLKTQKHFEMYMGQRVEISLYKAINGTKKLTGILENYNNGEVIIDIEGEKITLQKPDYGKINLYFDINEILKNSKNE